jgi:hypothetical protein
MAVLAAALFCGCASPTAPSTRTAIFVGAGDIARCNNDGATATAALLDLIPGEIFTAGDNAYDDGSADEFRDCYDPTWGRHKSRTHPAPGNHDYNSPGALPYFDYFGAAAGPRGVGYYAFRLGNWTIYSLNSETDASAGSRQLAWLHSQIALRSVPRCTLAIWHRPLYSSGPHGNNPDMREIWKALYDAGADVVLNGHDHLYERFAPQDADGHVDPTRGIREFVVGTGGGNLHVPGPQRPNSEVLQPGVWGVLKLTLSDGDYQWEFLTVTGTTADAGSGGCH